MNCGYPIILNGRAFGCGQCFTCRVNQRRVWTHRLMLEAQEHAENAFVTLTYSPENTPEDESLRPADLRNYFKRLRKKLEPVRFRYFAVGEYGKGGGHPHYHIALFGTPTCRRNTTRLSRSGKPCCDICSLHANTWGMGHVFLGTLNEQSAAYTVGYVIKKLYRKGEEENASRHPEFARMSNRPGIGAAAMDEVASTILNHNLETSMIDVPVALRHGKKILPLGKYLRRRLRTRLGRQANAPQEVLDQMEAEVSPLREAAFATAQKGFKSIAFREALIKQNHGKIIRLQRLEQLNRRNRSL